MTLIVPIGCGCGSEDDLFRLLCFPDGSDFLLSCFPDLPLFRGVSVGPGWGEAEGRLLCLLLIFPEGIDLLLEVFLDCSATEEGLSNRPGFAIGMSIGRGLAMGRAASSASLAAREVLETSDA